MKLDTFPRFPADSKLMERKLTDLFRDIANQVNLTPPGSTSQITYNASGVPGASSNFTYDSATNTLTVGNITGSALAMTIQPKAPDVTEDADLLTLRARNAAKSNSNGGGVTVRSGSGLGTGVAGTVTIAAGTSGTQFALNASSALMSLPLGAQFEAVDGGFTFQGGTDGGSGEIFFNAPLNTGLTGCNPIRFGTDTGDVFVVGETTFGTQEIGLFGAMPVAQSTGWGSPTGTATKTTFATGTVTTSQLAERVKAIIDYLKLRGDFGS